MSTAHQTGFNDAIQQGLRNACVEIRYHISQTQDDTRIGFTDSCAVKGSNPKVSTSGTQTIWQRDTDGDRIVTNYAPTFEADGDQPDIEQFKVRIDLGGGAIDWGSWNGFTQTFNDAYQVSFSQWHHQLSRAGHAYALLEGANNLTADVYLLNSNNNLFNEAWAEKTGSSDPSEAIKANATRIGYNNDLSFTNTSGGSRTVGGIRVVWRDTSQSDNIGETIIESSFSSDITLAGGNELIFTTLKESFPSGDLQ